MPVMTTQELEKQLNSLATEYFKFEVEVRSDKGVLADLTGDLLTLNQNYKGEVIVYVVNNDDREKMLKIVPPNNKIDFWYLDTGTRGCLFDDSSLPVYIKSLEVILKFLKEKNEGAEK